jgi:NAD(P)-dependent dehydrogenase (short-subunit alcohol dehydrogenase family)
MTNTNEISGLVALVSGAGSRVGVAMVRLLAERGAGGRPTPAA